MLPLYFTVLWDYLNQMNSIRPAAVAGAFYPSKFEELNAMIMHFLGEAQALIPLGAPAPKAIVTPHAGYIYSGANAALAYARLKPATKTINRVVLLGPCHRVSLKGVALSSADTFVTPLGEIPIDCNGALEIIDLPQVHVFDKSHAEEHSLEVQLPFLQVVLDQFKVLPIVVGDCPPSQIAEILNILWGGPETLIVISSDLSHFMDYDAARNLDDITARAIETLSPENIKDNQACGRFPLKGLLVLAKQRDLRVETLGLCNSGDTVGSKDRVVGYGSWAFLEQDDFEAKTHALLNVHGKTLLKLAAQSIQHGLTTAQPMAVNLDKHPKALGAPGASFVSLKLKGKLRGCIGSVKGQRPLAEDVAQNAFASAFNDHRFSSLSPDELEGLELSISILSPPTPMDVRDEKDLISQLRPGIDGLIIENKGKRALFLPSVWGQLPKPKDFLAHLKAKATMTPSQWSPNFKASRFITAEISAYGEDAIALWA
jgi:AmmeMemoRadiSam system protein B/AmmeMemoRadiSam system protein A